MLDANVAMMFLEKDILLNEHLPLLKRSLICITPITIHIMFYFWENKRINCTYTELINFFERSEKLSMSSNVYATGYKLSKSEDIEDGMQVATCLENAVKHILTDDGNLFAKYAKIIETTLIQPKD